MSIIVKGKLTTTVNPPHCTQVTKSTDYQAKYNYDYPVVYIPPGQREAFQRLFCIKPPTVNYEGTVVCDWVAPPEVQFTFGDEYMHVVRQDPTGRYLGSNRGQIFYTAHGLLTTWATNVTIPVPDNMRMIFIKVIVDSTQEPKVNYDHQSKTINIKYSWHQAPSSSFKIIAQGYLFDDKPHPG
ncbi:unnamed protein product [Arctia plantaginis]|uniref:Uncharacterized protein n=1 Tax=Arctia plantaginis TaxID=874455 RepID=A0A8S1AKC7_ARCPL|nr:unnamed protein product [Arctia plantaginis]